MSNATKKVKRNWFLSGMATVLQLFPIRRKTYRCRLTYHAHCVSLRRDYRAICNDGAKLGRDLRTVLRNAKTTGAQ